MKQHHAASLILLALSCVGRADIQVTSVDKYTAGVTTENFESSAFTPVQTSNLDLNNPKNNALLEPVSLWGGLGTIQSGTGTAAEPYNSGIIMAYTSDSSTGGFQLPLGPRTASYAPTQSGTQGIFLTNSDTTQPYTATITFSQDEDFFGGYFMTPLFQNGDANNVSFTFLDANGNPISTVYPSNAALTSETLAIDSPTAKASGETMLGVGYVLTQRDSSVFRSVQITGYNVAMDDLVVGNVARPVPEPASCVILGVGFLGFLKSRRRGR